MGAVGFSRIPARLGMVELPARWHLSGESRSRGTSDLGPGSFRTHRARFPRGRSPINRRTLRCAAVEEPTIGYQPELNPRWETDSGRYPFEIVERRMDCSSVTSQIFASRFGRERRALPVTFGG